MTDSKTNLRTGSLRTSLPARASQAEIDAWASASGAREGVARGPSDEERADYAAHLRQRRLAEAFDEGDHSGAHAPGHPYSREAQLATEGRCRCCSAGRNARLPSSVKAGREWEEETALPTHAAGCG